MTTVAIVGAGPVGRATAAYLASHGHAVALWSPSGASAAPLARGAGAPGRGVIVYRGAIAGEVEVGLVTDPAALSAFEVVLIALPGHAYPSVLARVLPALRSHQTVIVSGALSAVPLWIHERAAAAGEHPTVVSWGTTLCTARRAPDVDVEVNTLRARFEVAAIPATRLDQAAATCRTLFGDRFNPVGNMLATALANVNPVAHAAEVLPNLTRMERGEHWFLFDCLTPAAGRMAETIDRERIAIARAFGLAVRSLAEHYHLSYHVPRGSVAQIAAAIHARDGAPPGPTTLDHRYVVEDVPYGLVFYEVLATAAGVDVPVMSAAITLLGAVYGRDFRAENRLLGELGLDRMTPAEILARALGRPC